MFDVCVRCGLLPAIVAGLTTKIASLVEYVVHITRLSINKKAKPRRDGNPYEASDTQNLAGSQVLTNQTRKSQASQLESALFALASGLPLVAAQAALIDEAVERDCYAPAADGEELPEDCRPTIPRLQPIPSTVRSVRAPISVLDSPFDGEG